MAAKKENEEVKIKKREPVPDHLKNHPKLQNYVTEKNPNPLALHPLAVKALEKELEDEKKKAEENSEEE